MSERGEEVYTLTEAEIMSIKHFIDQQSILGLLKDKGAPITGTFSMKVKSGYDFKVEYDQLKFTYTYTFINKNKLEPSGAV